MEEKRERKKAQNKEVQANEYTRFDSEVMRPRKSDTEYAEEIASTPEEKGKRVDQAIDEDYSDY